jgi:multidrug efflux pump
MGIFVLPNANSIDVVKRVATEMEQIQRELPTGMQAASPYDGTAYINTAINDVFRTLAETLLIVCVVIFLFLGSWRSTIIPIIAIPISLIGAVFLMQVFGFTVNLLTLLAIVLSVGLVVDDAIVVVENVERHLRDGLTPLNAALLGARELVGPIIAMTITLAAVYIPVGIQGGLTGTLFREFAFTLAGAVAISGIVALTLSPVMTAKFLREGDSERGFAAKVNHVFERVRDWYGKRLDATLEVRPAVYTAWIGIAVLAAIFLQMSMAAKELAPTEDQGVIFGIVQGSANATIEQTSALTDAAGKVFMEFPQTEFVFQLTFPDQGFGGMVLKPWNQRKETAFELLPQVQAKLGGIPGIEMFPVMPPALPGGGQFPVELVILSTEEPERMLEFANRLQAKAMESKQFFFPPIIDTKIDQPQAEIVIDHDKVAALGLNLQQIGADVSAAMGGNFVNRFNIAGPQLQGDPAGEAHRSAESGSVEGHLRDRPGEQADPAEHRRDDQTEDCAAFAESHAAAQRDHHQRHVGSAD